MPKITLFILLAALLLAACASPAAPTERVATEPTQALAEPTAAPAQPTEPAAEPTAVPAEPTAPPSEPTASPEQAAASGGPLVYKIVPDESVVTYEVGETFFNQNNRFQVAVGKTGQITGDVQVDQANPQNSSIGPLSIDISQFQSDSGRRDNAIRERFLESRSYPMATFTPTSIEGLPAAYAPGEELTFKVTGDLTIKETTKPVTFDVTVRLEGDALLGTATTTILMSDFGVGPITMAGILGTEDEVKLTLTFVARS
jgi:polyisoprenoid-binding protein YceI